MNKKSLFDTLKKFTEEVTHSSEKLFQKIAETLTDESQMHRVALSLHHKIQTTVRDYKDELDAQIKQYVEDFLFEINTVLELDSESSSSKYPVEQLELAERCMQMIENFKSRLEAAPELWKQIQVHVNVYLEEVIKTINTFETEDTEFAEDAAFVEHKQRLIDLKNKLVA